MNTDTRKDAFGCADDGLLLSQDYQGDGFSFHRKKAVHTRLHRVETAPEDRGYLLGVAMSGGHRRSILRGATAGSHRFEPHGLYVRAFAERYQADLSGPMDFLLFEVSDALLAQAAGRGTTHRAPRLSGVAGHADPKLAALAARAAQLLAGRADGTALLFDQLALTIAACLGGHEPGAEAPRPRSTTGLSPLMQARAKELLRSRLDGALTIAEIADACSLSRSYFIQSFRLATGVTPHQWLTDLRIETARGALQGSDKTLAQIAMECGFSDQSHFTRAFTRAAGMSPGSWRKRLAS